MPESAEPEQSESRPAAVTSSQVGNMSARAIEPLFVALAGSSITAATVDTVLRDGGNREKSVLRIAAYYMKDKAPAENADFMRREFVTGRLSQPGGKGFQIGMEQTSVWFDETGITLGRGKSALHSKDSAHITWEQAAVRVRELLDAGLYTSRDVMDEALDNEHHELAERLLHLYRDDFRDFAELPEAWQAERGGWPEDVALVTELLKDKDGEYSEYRLILERLEEDVAALATDPDAPTRFWHDPHRLLQDMRDLGITPRYFPSAEQPAPAFMPFITEDEVDAYLTRGSNVAEGKFRIFSFFLHEHTAKERADFLKNEYGHGGHSHALGADNSWANSEPGKGIVLTRGGLSNPYDTVTLSWNAAEKRMNKLIQDGRYMNRAGLDRIPEYERILLARSITHFHYNLPEEYERPFPKELDFYYPHDAEREAISDLLDNTERVDAVLAAMRPIMENTLPEDRYYSTRKRAFDDLTAWRNGTYTLFPGVSALPVPEQAAKPQPQPPAQLSLFDVSPHPVFPSVEAQRTIIAEAIKAEEMKNAPTLPPITQDEIDALIIGALKNPESRARIERQFTENPRSRDAAQMLKEEYSSLAFTMPRMDGDEGYMGLLGEDGGVAISKGAPATTPLSERPPAQTLILPWPKLQKRVAELVEAGRFIAVTNDERELDAPEESAVYHSPQRLIPYHAGDAVDALSADDKHVRLVLDHVDEDYVYYTMPDDLSDQKPVEMFRTRFEGYLDDGQFTIMEPGAVLPLQENAEPQAPAPITVESLIDEALHTPSSEPYSDRAVAGLLLQGVRGIRIDPVDFFNRSNEGRYDLDRAARIRGFIYRALEHDTRLLLGLPEDQRMPDPFSITSKAWESAQPQDKIETPEGNRYLLLMRNHYAEHMPVLIDDENGSELRRIHFRVADTDPAMPGFTGHVDAYSIQEAARLISHKDYVITFVEPLESVEARETEPAAEPETPASQNRPPAVGDTDFLASDLDSVNADLRDVLENGLLAQAFRDDITEIVEAGVTNDDLTEYLSLSFPNEVNEVTLETGETADYSTTPQGVSIEIPDKFNTNLGFSWADIAPIVRSLSQIWEPAEEQPAIAEPEPAHAQPQTAEAAPVLPEPDFDTVAATVLERVMEDADYIGDLTAATSRASLRNPCTWALEQSIRDHEQDEPAIYHKYFSDYDWNERLFNHVLRESWANRPTPEIPEPEREQQQTEPEQHPDGQPDHAQSKETEPETSAQGSQAEPAAPTGSPPPVFFVDWKTAQHDFNLNLYKDRDVLGYNVDGVEYVVGRSGNFTYISETGMFWGGNEVPGNIYEQINTYKNGELTDDQVRENYLKILSEYEAGREAVTDAPPPPAEPFPETSAPPQAAPAAPFSEITRADTDAALLRWNGDLDSKILVYQYMREHPRARDTANVLREEYGDDLPGLPITKDGAEPVTLPWPSAQRHLARLIEAGLFLAPEEQDYLEREYRDFEDEALPDVESADMELSELAIEPARPAVNFRIADDHLGEGGQKTKYGYNVAAIRTLKQIEAEGRTATPEEQETLSRYVGWGGLPQAFDANRDGWQKEYAELKELLTPEEYDLARASTLNAHYTSPTVIKAMYEAVERMGFRRGNVLEPALGVGNFFGLLPESMKDAKLYGVELDSVTGRIARQLYPNADIKVTGFEKTDMPDAFFDLAIGNVPFGNYPVADQRYKQNFHVHDYFFAKTLDQVRPGGVVAFVTSRYTLDKQNPEIRKYIAQRAELLGAVRLPNNAFLKNAGTEVTADILFFKRRDRLMDIQPDWVHLGVTENGIPINRYFADNPEMVLGTIAYDDRMYGDKREIACQPIPGADLAEQLRTAIANIEGQIDEAELDDIEGIEDNSIPADPAVRNFSYTLVDDRVYFRENSAMYPVELPATTLDRIRGMVGLRNCVHDLIDLQLNEYGDAEIAQMQAELNRLYDDFTAEYGLINSTGNSRAFSADSAYYLLCSLEILDEDNNLQRKADMFTRRTIKQKTVITSVDTSSEALAVSIAEKARVDIDYMASLTGFTPEKIISDLDGVIFCDIGNPNRLLPAFDAEKMKVYEKFPLVTADEYLSGNVRDKLQRARNFIEAVGDSFHGINTAANIMALEAAQPKDLDASEIAVRLGSTWVDSEYIKQFMTELLQPSYNLKNVLDAKYFGYTGEWRIEGKNRIPYNNVAATVTFGTERMNAYQILEETLNLRDVRVYDTKYEDGKEKRVLNKNETMKAQQKQEDIKRAFKDWIWKDPQRRQDLVRKYNDLFNSSRPREYDGSHITFSGISPDITLRSHQLNAVAHILYGGNTLLAHEVGAGKTFEMVAAAMESKRLGLCQKSLFAVPNHLTEQWAGEFLRLYPSANILVATKKDFEMRNRKKFCAKISTGDYDAVIIGHSQLEKIPMSVERQERLLQEQIWEVMEGIDELKSSRGENFAIKQLERTRKSLEARLKNLTEGKRRDDVVTFEQLGVDRLYIDESHFFKNLFLYTKMRNVAGLSTSDAQKSSDLFMKCRYMDELTGGKGVIFATGTPISNSMTEMYTIQRYLQYDLLARKNLTHFDSWASTFGETVTAIELAPEGTGYRARTRFSKFHNLPELMQMFREVADVKTADTLDLPRPEANYETIVVKPSELQKEMVQELSERAAVVHANLVDPHIDNMLKITTDGRKIGLDQRLINPMLPDDEDSKVNACAGNILKVWQDTEAKRLSQLVFCDFSTPNKDGRFNVYDDIRAKLLEKGIPEDEIAFIHDANTEARKKELFAKVRQGKVRVLFGSTFKMGAGTNVQDRLIALHDLDCPWRPSDLEQRAGRIVRQGNNNPEVYIFRYATEGTFDAYLWQTVENKQKFISQIMTSKSPVRACEDVDETSLSYAEIKALCAGNPLIKEKIDLDIEVARLRILKADFQSQHYRLEDNLLKYYPENIEAAKARIAGAERDIERYNAHLPKLPETPPTPVEPAASVKTATPGEDDKTATAAPPFPTMTVLGVDYAEKEPAAKALLEACKSVIGKDPVKIGSYLGFDMSISFDSFYKKFNLTLKGDLSYGVELGTDTFGNITRINNAFRSIPERITSSKTQLESLYQQVEDAKKELQHPFAQAAALAEKEARLAIINAELNIDGGNNTPAAEPELRMAVNAKSARPSILEGLRSFGAGKETGQPEKPKTNDRLI